MSWSEAPRTIEADISDKDLREVAQRISVLVHTLAEINSLLKKGSNLSRSEIDNLLLGAIRPINDVLERSKKDQENISAKDTPSLHIEPETLYNKTNRQNLLDISRQINLSQEEIIQRGLALLAVAVKAEKTGLHLAVVDENDTIIIDVIGVSK